MNQLIIKSMNLQLDNTNMVINIDELENASGHQFSDFPIFLLSINYY